MVRTDALVSKTIQTISTSIPARCAAFTLPAGGVFSLPGQAAITLASAAQYLPPCATLASSPVIAAGASTTPSADAASIGDTPDDISDFRDHFYASIFPQCYALAATTVLAYTLVIMLFITPRSFLDGGVLVLGKRSFTRGGSGGTNIGGRPALQKGAAMFVAVALTIATVNTFRAAEDQYDKDIENASLLQQEVLGGTELKAIRIVSEAFLWLAQAQTLTRLFPRQREKVIIKWTAFALIALGIIFDALDSFVYTANGATRPRSFTEAVPALNYLFQLSLGVLYAAWVLYYAIMKKQYAFYHTQMRNMWLMAVLSIVSILVPVVFFILDISKPDFTGWGDYVRWVGGAAASVFVWEWVERIEALEREEKKDGILGREVFDGDEMLGMSSYEFSWPRKRKPHRGSEGGEGGDISVIGATRRNKRDNDADDTGVGHDTAAESFKLSNLVSRYAQRNKSGAPHDAASKVISVPAPTRSTGHDRQPRRLLQPPLWSARPPVAVTPVSRTDTASADSTVYVVRFDPLSDTSRSNGITPPLSTTPGMPRSHSRHNSADSGRSPANETGDAQDAAVSGSTQTHIHNPKPQTRARPWARFVKMKNDAGEEESKQRPHKDGSGDNHDNDGRWDLRGRFEGFAASKAEQLREKIRPTIDTTNLPVTIVPAPPRRGAALAQLLEEEEHSNPMTTQPAQYQVEYDPDRAGPSSPPLWRSAQAAALISSNLNRQSPLSASGGSSLNPGAARAGPSISRSTASVDARGRPSTSETSGAAGKRSV